MRVIAGKYRHRLLDYPDSNPDIRPTKDRIREALFSILGPLENKVFLDLYAGSGSIGIEAISRGAKKTIFVDNNESALNYVKNNLKSLSVTEDYEVLFASDFAALETLKNRNEKLDIIFIDPPYQKGKYEELLSYIYNNDLLVSDGVIAIESNRQVNTNELLDKRIKEYHYGDILLTIIRS